MLTIYLNKAAEYLAVELLKYGAKHLPSSIFGSPDERSLKSAFKCGFEHLLQYLNEQLEPELAQHIAYLIMSSIENNESRKQITRLLLDQDPSVSDYFISSFIKNDIDHESLPIPIEQISNVLVKGIADGLQAEAERSDSPLFNLYVLRRLRSFEIYAQAVYEQNQLSARFSPSDFTSVAASFERIDRHVLRAVRDHTYLTKNEVRNIYRALLKQGLNDQFLSLADVVNSLRTPEYRGKLLASIHSPSLYVHTDTKMTTIEFKAKSSNLILDNPSLVWDCTCNEKVRAPEKCPIHSREQATDIENKFYGGLVEFVIDGRKYFWRNSDALFPPGIDALRMISTLERNRVIAKSATSMLDIGCGTGFLGLQMTKYMPRISRLGFTDWLLTPVLYTAINFQQSSLIWTICDLMELHLGLDSDSDGELLASGPFDVALCNPPYLPIVDGYEELSIRTTTFGTDLLCDVIKNKDRIARQLFVSFSQIAWNDACNAALESGKRLIPIDTPWDVPFRNPYVEDYPGYINKLLEKKVLFFKESDPTRIYHSIQVYEVT